MVMVFQLISLERPDISNSPAIKAIPMHNSLLDAVFAWARVFRLSELERPYSSNWQRISTLPLLKMPAALSASSDSEFREISDQRPRIMSVPLITVVLLE
jgi:hypothetical protein